MQVTRPTLGADTGNCARLALRRAVGYVGGVLLTPSRGCQLVCSASSRPLNHSCGWRTPRVQGRRNAVVCNAAARNFYELLGVSQSASDRDIKSAYRKLAMKLHPDVNKAPDAQKRFMEVKVAYETLSDSRQRAEYDRRLRMGGFGSTGGRTGGSTSSSSYGGAASGGGWGPYGPYSTGPNFTRETVPGVDELVRELEKEFTAWVNSRSKGGKEKSLLEELEDLGGELLDFLEESLGIKDEPPAAGSTSASNPQGAARDTRSAAERFDDIWKQYGDGTAPGSSTTSNSTAGAGSATGAYRSGPSSAASSRPGGPSTSPSSSANAPPRPGRSDEDDIDAQLQALKKKLNKL
ncbi:hypothetical protein PLESTB_000339100 [Pleodorina starrii]|uniref:J domain-containing protein n=1 Tax=Pleodorina starrii TaxID=330485 RepID=A0A9W6BDD3_9CHLO|nr:hypothetical protein PLESTB_000339100 [Pleodorina starrii]GLC73145.1 hypothetical protein PLESTF_001337000 [Pleodorina starrii]